MDLKSYQAGRTDGLQLALRLVKEGGQEALEKEIKFRNQYGINTAMTEKELEKASVAVKEMTIDTVTIMALHTLHDEFGFGPSRADRFVNRFNQKSGVYFGWAFYLGRFDSPKCCGIGN